MKLKTWFVIIVASLVLGLPLGAKIAKKYGRITYAHGLYYYGPVTPTPTMADSNWTSLPGKIFPYTLSYPKNLNFIQFTNDPHDSVGVGGPQKLVLFVEKINVSPKKFVTDYWQQYSGLSGLKSLKEFQNEAGISGFEASYNYKSDTNSSLDIFLLIPNDQQHLIHLMKGDLKETTFREIVSRFKFND
jgi:hypothetical protein